jgi:phosphatidate cytidylyltransferase
VKDLRTRTITAVVYAAVVLVGIFGPAILFWVLLIVMGILGLMELLPLRAGRPALAFAALFFLGLVCLGALKQLGPFAARHGTADDLPVWLILAVLPTWAADVIAYLAGTALGRRRLAPSISPGKTWEGTVAGFAASAVVVLAVAATFGLPRAGAAIAAVGIGPIGLAGDLLESYAKRRAGVKDSGTIFPGHGGVLDRLDSLVAVATFLVLVIGIWGLASLGSEGGSFGRF